MKQWKVSLLGNDFDLKDLLKFNSSEMKITEESDGYYITAKKFASCREATEVEILGKEIIAILNGTAQLRFENWENVKFGGVNLIEENGKRIVFLSAKSQGRSRMHVDFTITNADGTVITSSQKNNKSLFDVAISDDKIEKAMRIFGSREHSWKNLYVIYEIIESDVCGKSIIVKNGWSSKADVDLFKRTANSAKAIGDDARHHNENPPPSKPMELSEAKLLIRNLLKNWIGSKN